MPSTLSFQYSLQVFVLYVIVKQIPQREPFWPCNKMTLPCSLIYYFLARTANFSISFGLWPLISFPISPTISAETKKAQTKTKL